MLKTSTHDVNNVNLKHDSIIKEHEERYQMYPTSNFWSIFNILDEIMQNSDCFLSVFWLLNTCLYTPVISFWVLHFTRIHQIAGDN